MLRSIILFVAMLNVGAALAAAGEPPRMKRHEGDHVQLDIPEKASVAKTRGVDFEVYVVTYQRRTLLRIYVGNAPSFPTRAFPKSEADKAERQEKAGVVVRSLRRVTDGRYSREVLVDMSKATGDAHWPNSYHLWYGALPRELAVLADVMIDSIDLGIAPKD